MPVERLIPLAKQLLLIDLDETRRDQWLWEHSLRVMNLTQKIATFPEIAAQNPDPTALAAAALFHDAGWVLEHQQGRYQRWQILTRPTNDIQRELAAAMLQEEGGHLLPASSTRLAVEAIRHCNNRQAELLEAQILAEAEALDEMGTTYILRQFRQYQAEGRPLQQLVDSWMRQKEYSYWEVRLNDGFRWDQVRQLARARLEAIDAFVAALQRDLHATDVDDVLQGLGVSAAPDTP